jgi:hypothetical protein
MAVLTRGVSYGSGCSSQPVWLNAAIELLNLAKDTCGIPPAQVAFGSVSILLAMIRVRSFYSAAMDFLLMFIQDSMANEQDYIDLGLNCAEVCKALNRGLDGRQLDELSSPCWGRIEQLTT